MSSPIPTPGNRLSVRIVKATEYNVPQGSFVSLTVEDSRDFAFDRIYSKKGQVISYNMSLEAFAVLLKVIADKTGATAVASTKKPACTYLDKKVVFEIAQPTFREVLWPKLFGKTVIPDMLTITGGITSVRKQDLEW